MTRLSFLFFMLLAILDLFWIANTLAYDFFDNFMPFWYLWSNISFIKRKSSITTLENVILGHQKEEREEGLFSGPLFHD